MLVYSYLFSLSLLSNFLFPIHCIRSFSCSVFLFQPFRDPWRVPLKGRARKSMCCWRRFVRFLCIQSRAISSSHRFLCTVAKWPRREPNDRSKTIVLRILDSPLSSSPPLPLLPPPISRGTDFAARVRRIIAINYEGGRPKGVAKRRKGAGKRETDGGSRLALHTISTWSAVSLRENKVSLRSVRALRDAGERGRMWSLLTFLRDSR